MPRLLIVNRAQAPYYKALYSALANELGKDWEILLQTLDKHWKGFDGDRFSAGVWCFPREWRCRSIEPREFLAWESFPSGRCGGMPAASGPM